MEFMYENDSLPVFLQGQKQLYKALYLRDKLLKGPISKDR